MPQVATNAAPNSPSTKGAKPRALSPLFIKGITPPDKGRDDYPDGDTPGLSLRVPAKGDYGWTLRMRDQAGKQRRFELGDMIQGHGLAWAREEAKKLKYRIRHEGADPHRDRKEKVEAARLTLRVLIKDWSEIRLAGRKPRYVAEATRALHVTFRAELDRAASDLTTGDVRQIIRKLQTDGHPAMARTLVAYGRAAFTWAVKRNMIAANPFLNQDTTVTPARDRVLDDEELCEIMRAAAAAGTYGTLVLLLAFTAQRRDEVAAMAWSEVSADRSVWTIPAARAKNGKNHLVPLSPSAQALLPKVRTTGLVFPAERSAKAFTAWSKDKTRLEQAIAAAREEAARATGEPAKPFPAWRLHDLRRTAATGLQRLGVALPVTEAVLNHVSGSRAGIVGIYQRHDYAEEKRAALATWGNYVTDLISR